MTVNVFGRTAVLMDTFVSIQVVGGADGNDIGTQLDCAFGWFKEVEERCTRFDPASEVMGLTAQVGRAVEVSPLLFEAIRFALEVSRASGGAFDPTVGHALEARGFNREYRTGRIVDSGIDPDGAAGPTAVRLEPSRRLVTLLRPLVLDLGAVAKGLAIDLAAQELRSLGGNFSINAGGDVYVGGSNAEGEPWRVGIRHPREPGAILETLRVSNLAVCTSGDYERPSNVSGEHHIVDPRTGRSPAEIASLTVVAPSAMVADALGTAAFVLGPERGLAFLEREGVEGSIVASTLESRETSGYARYRA